MCGEGFMKNLNSIEIESTLMIEKQLKIREVWLSIASSVASANDCKRPSVAIDWANEITDAYIKRFGDKG